MCIAAGPIQHVNYSLLVGYTVIISRIPSHARPLSASDASGQPEFPNEWVHSDDDDAAMRCMIVCHA